MLDLRDMEILTALARHGHFARAAEACGISQPAFSTRIRNLEQKLGAPVVKRGNRFAGFTTEGEIALVWARRILQDAEAMRQDVTAARKGLTGHVALGAIPTAVPVAARAAIALKRAHPGLMIEIRSSSSRNILRELGSFDMDVALTYLEGLDRPLLRAETLYEERYVLLAPRRLVDARVQEIGWREAADIPLCLMSTDMTNRKIIDRVFASIGVTPVMALETNAFTAALVQVSAGLAATIAPVALVESLPMSGEIATLPLTDPEVAEPVGLVWTGQEPEAPTVRAILEAFRGVVSVNGSADTAT